MKRHDKILIITRYGKDWMSHAIAFDMGEVEAAAEAYLRHDKGHRLLIDGEVEIGTWQQNAPLMEAVKKLSDELVAKAPIFRSATGNWVALLGASWTPRWFYKSDGNGRFDVYNNDIDILRHFDPSEDPRTFSSVGRVLTGVNEGDARRHIEMAEKVEADRDAYRKLAEPHLNREDWKLPAKELTYEDEETADRVADALAYFVGGSFVRPIEGGFTVGSEGYYHHVGA
jgi:hypothetical protein